MTLPQLRSKITGTGSSLPDKILTNFDLEKMVDTSDEWITTRTGIKERRIAADNEFTSTFAVQASRKALEMANVAAEELDLIIMATVTPDFPFPATSCIVQDEIGAVNATVFDISAACSGFVYGLSVADKFIRTGTYKKILVIGAEVLSRVVNWNERNTCVLFGDGSGAAVIEPSIDNSGILSTHLSSNGSHWKTLYLPACGSRNPAFKQNTIVDKLYYLKMDGNDVFKYAVRTMEDAAKLALTTNNMSSADISIFIPHQANLRIVEALGKRLKVAEDKVFVNLHKYGNTSAASIPIALDEANRLGLIKSGDIVLLDAFGGGFTCGSALIRW